MEDAEINLLGINHDMKSTVLIKENYSLMPYTPEKAMAAHSSTLVWKIPWTEEPGRLQSMGSLRVGHD